MISPAVPSHAAGTTSGSALASLQDQIDKIKNNLNQDPPLFTTYSVVKFGILADYSLVDGARLDGNTLVNPGGGKLDLSTLSSLPGLTGVTMLNGGGFQLTYTPSGAPAGTGPGEVTIIGATSVSATARGLTIDGIGVQPMSTSRIIKTGDSLSVTGSATVTINSKTFTIQTKEINKQTVFSQSQGRLVSVTIPSTDNLDYSINHNKHEIMSQGAQATIYLSRDDYAKAAGNKILLTDRVDVSQTTGKLLVDRYYLLDNGRFGLVRRPFLKGPAPPGLSYTFQGTLIGSVGPISTEKIEDYDTIAGLFSSMGYGTGAKNRAARRAYYTQYIGGGYRGTAKQNIALLNKIKSGEIPMFPASEANYFVTSERGAFPSTETFPSMVEHAQTDTSGAPAVESRVPIDQRRRTTRLVTPLGPPVRPERQPPGSIPIVDSPPEGAMETRGQVTYYYTPLYDPNDHSGNSEQSLDIFKDKVIGRGKWKHAAEGSGVFFNQEDQRWYYQSYDADPVFLNSQNQFGLANKKPLFMGAIAAPREIARGSIAYVEKTDGTYARFIVHDRGSAIQVTDDGRYHIDIFTGVGRNAYNAAVSQNSMGIARNPRIFFVKPPS